MPNCHSGFCRARRRRNEVIRTVKKLDQLTEALNYEGYDLMRSFLYPHLLVRNSQILEGTRHVTQHLWNFTSPKIRSIHLIFLQILHNLALGLWRKLLQFWGLRKLLIIRWVTKLKLQLLSQQQRNKLICLFIWNIKLLCLTMILLLALNIG